MNATVSEHLRRASMRLASVSPSARLDAELLLSHALRISRAALVARGQETPDAPAAQHFAQLLERRAQGEPVSYLLGTQGFWTLDLQVTPAVLIPRPETETLVEWALERLAPAGAAPAVLDLGTGSGCIALALASERPRARVVATDRSPAALELARDNARRLGVDTVEFRQGEWFGALTGSGERFDLVLSNPPYVAEGDPHLVDLRHEPRTALVAGPDGLDDLRRIVAQAAAWLVSGGWLLVEHGYDQGERVRGLFEAAGFGQVSTRRDLGGQERVTAGCRP